MAQMWLNMYNYVIIPLIIRNTGPLQCLPSLRYNQSTINHQKPTPRDFMMWSLYGQLSWVLKSTEISAALLLTNMLKEVFATCSLSLLLSDSVLLFCRSAVRLFVAAAITWGLNFTYALCSHSILPIHETKQLFEHNFQCSGTVNRMRNNGNYLYTLTSLYQLWPALNRVFLIKWL